MKTTPTPLRIDAVEPTLLPSLPWAQKGALPNCAAIYFVMNAHNEVLYIGQTRALTRRFLQHHRQTDFVVHGAVRIAWLVCDTPSLLKEIEKALLRHFVPALNMPEGRPKTASADFIAWPTRLPPDMLTRIKAKAAMACRPINWQIMLLLERALEHEDAEERMAAPSHAAGVT